MEAREIDQILYKINNYSGPTTELSFRRLVSRLISTSIDSEILLFSNEFDDPRKFNMYQSSLKELVADVLVEKTDEELMLKIIKATGVSLGYHTITI